MKILYVSTISNTVNAFLIPHIKMHISEGHTVDVAFNVEQEVKEEIINLGCKIFELPFNRSPFRNDFKLLINMVRNLVLEQKYDIVHTHTPMASVIVRMACKDISNIKVIYTAHGFHFFEGASMKNWIFYYPVEKWLSKYTDLIITINQEDYENAKKLDSKSTYFVPGVGINLEKFTPQNKKRKMELRRNKYNISQDDFVLFYAAELSDRKNHQMLLKCMKKIQEINPKIKLLLAGQGNNESLIKKYIEENNLKNISILGYRNDINQLMQISDIVVSVSKQEGLPVNIMEAMATGLPLIVTDCRGNRDLVSNGKNGYIVKLGDVNGLVNRICDLYNNPELIIKFGNESLSMIKQYSIQNVNLVLKDLYNKL